MTTRIAVVTFRPDGPEYRYWCLTDEVQVGDAVRVPTGVATVKFFERVDARTQITPMAYILGRAQADIPTNVGNINRLKEARVKDILRELETRNTVFESIKKFTALAKTDKHAAKLVKELKELVK